MTTAPLPTGTRTSPVRGAPELRVAAGATCALALVAVLVAVVVSGTAGAAGAAIGTGTVLVFYGFGALTVNAVASVSPGASLLVALLTYTLQVVAVGMVFLALDVSGAVGSSVDRTWVAVGVVAATIGWLAAHIFVATRSRQPIYDLPVRSSAHPDDPPDGSAS